MVLNNLYDTDGSDDMVLSWDMLEDDDDDDDDDDGDEKEEEEERASSPVLSTAATAPPEAAANDEDNNNNNNIIINDDDDEPPLENDASVGVTISRTPTTATPDDESLLDNDVSIGVTISDGDTIISGVSSITGENRTVSDIEDGEDDDEGDEDDDDGGPRGEAMTEEPRRSPEAHTSESTGDGGMGGDRAAVMAASSSTDNDVALATCLSEMGFEMERIARAVSHLRDAGVADIDPDVVIGIMTDETAAFDVADDDRRAASSSCSSHANIDHHPLDPLLDAWEYVGSTISRGWDGRRGGGVGGEAPDARPRRTAGGVRAIGRTARGAWCSVADESHRLVRRLVNRDRGGGGGDCDDDIDVDYDVDRARKADRHSAATAQMRSAKDTFRRANEEHRILEKVVAVAVVGSAALLALGNPRASLGAMAVAGATLAAGEAMRCSSEQSCGGGSRGHGLHLD
jgi:hypothetical protein